MGFHELILAHSVPAQTAGVSTRDFSDPDPVLRGVTDERIRMHPQRGFPELDLPITRDKDIGIAVAVTVRIQVFDERGPCGSMCRGATSA